MLLRTGREEPGRGDGLPTPAPAPTTTRPRLPWLTLVGLVNAPFAIWFFLIEQSSFLHGRMSRGQVAGRDFVNYWSGAKLLVQGRAGVIFDQDAYMRFLQGLFGQGLATHSFSYPPSILPLIVWLGALPYGLALDLWSLVGVGSLFAAAWPYSRRPLTALLILASPAVLMCLDVGQNGLITSALLIGGLRLIDKRPWLGGALIGLATFKPQLGLLIPLALIAAWRWKAIGGAAASAIVLALLGTLLAGPQGWTLYLTKTLAYQRVLFEQSVGAWSLMTPSPLASSVYLGLPHAFGVALQIAVSLACAAAVIVRFHRIRSEGRPIRGADILLLTAAGFMAAPYSFNYDMPGVVLALILTARERTDLETSGAWRWGSALLWAAPLWMTLLGIAALLANARWAAGPALVGGGLILVWLALAEPKSAAKPA